jgi:hypothetical protein
VAVGDEHHVNLAEALQVFRAGGVALHPGINQNRLALGCVDLEGAVAEPGELDAARIHKTSWATED